MERKFDVAGAAHMVVLDGVALLQPDAQVFECMLDGWRQQQLSRNLAFATVEARAETVRRFQAHTNAYPWQWAPGHLEEWTTDLRANKRRARSTIRSYQLAVRAFLAYLCDPVYGWADECERRFGTHPVQICHDWNTGAHLSDYEGRPARRSLTRREVQALFDCADAQVAEIRARGRKGWVAAFRDATMLKVTYAWGLRRREAVMLEAHDFGINPKAPEFGSFGVLYVRHGKASAGGSPKRRSVLTVMPWSAEVAAEWVENIWPQCRREGEAGLWPSERRPRVSEDRLNAAFGRFGAEAGLSDGLGVHSLRHSYVTHLIEDGFDALFVQQQVGHQHASTTSIYTSVSSDYKTRVLRAALDRVVADARAQERSSS